MENKLKVKLHNGLVVETPHQSEVVEVHYSGEWHNVAVFEPAEWKQAEALYEILRPIYEDSVRIERFY